MYVDPVYMHNTKVVLNVIVGLNWPLHPKMVPMVIDRKDNLFVIDRVSPSRSSAERLALWRNGIDKAKPKKKKEA